MKAEHCKSASSGKGRESQPIPKRSSGSVRESAELRRALEQVKNALVRLEIELRHLEVILSAAHRETDHEQQERIQ